MGLVLVAGHAAAVAGAGVRFVFDAHAAVLGASGGAVLMLANALLIESLGRVAVSLGSTIYRLNTVAVVAFAVAFLGEALTWRKLAGVTLAVVAVILLYRRGRLAGDSRPLLTALWIAVSASLLRAAFGIVSKFGVAGGTDPFVFMVYVGCGWTLA